MLLLISNRCTSHRTGATIRPETPPVLFTVRLRRRAAIRPQMEGSQEGSTLGDGGVRHVTAGRYHGGDLSGGRQHGKHLLYCFCQHFLV